MIVCEGSIGHAFTVCIQTENQNQASFYPFVPREISVLSVCLEGGGRGGGGYLGLFTSLYSRFDPLRYTQATSV